MKSYQHRKYRRCQKFDIHLSFSDYEVPILPTRWRSCIKTRTGVSTKPRHINGMFRFYALN